MEERQGYDTAMASVPGACYCGRIQFAVQSPPRFVCHCHCENCRRAHGAGFVTWAGFPAAQFAFEQGEGDLGRYMTDTGATRSFCKICGTTLFYESPRWTARSTSRSRIFENRSNRRRRATYTPTAARPGAR